MSTNADGEDDAQEPDARVAGYFAAVASRGNRGPIGELAVVLSRGILDPVAFLEHVKAHGVEREDWFRRQVLDLSFGFIVAGLDGGGLRKGYLESVRRVNAFLHIADGDFFELRPAEVAAVIGEQLDVILADAEVSREEELHQVELQAALDSDMTTTSRWVDWRLSAHSQICSWKADFLVQDKPAQNESSRHLRLSTSWRRRGNAL